MVRTALVLSGGGAKGAFQVGAERYAREVKGYAWSVIAGVSIGAVNGAFLAMRRYQELLNTWKTLSSQTVLGRSTGHAAHILRQVVLRKSSLYGDVGLRTMIEREIDPSKMVIDLRVGAVSLETGDYHVFSSTHPRFMDALIASASLPPVWPPVDVGKDFRLMVDGGVRKVSPIGDVLDANPDEIVVINCNPMHDPPMKSSRSAFDIGQRAFGISMHQIFRNDVQKFLLLNRLVGQAEAAGIVLRDSRGEPYRKYPCHIIDPDDYTGDTLDLSQAHVRRAMDAGWEKAKKVLG